MKILNFFAIILFVNFGLSSQNRVIQFKDLLTDEKIGGVKIMSGVDFLLSDENGKVDFNALFQQHNIFITANEVINQSGLSENVIIYNLYGQPVMKFQLLEFNSKISLTHLPFGYYILSSGFQEIKFVTDGKSYSSKVQVDNIICSHSEYNDLLIKKSEFANNSILYLTKKKYDLSHLNSIKSKSVFDLLKGKPFNQTNSNIESVKILFNVKADSIYYFNSFKYLVHYDFAFNVLKYPFGKNYFSVNEYLVSPKRTYLPAALDYYRDADKYILEISAFTELTCEDAGNLIQKVLKTTFIPSEKLFFKSNNALLNCKELSVIDINELTKNQVYQPLVLAENYGYLRKMSAAQLKDHDYSPYDILLIDEVPSEIGIVAGIISNDFQTPLSHVNVLAQNRGTPNMAYKASYQSPLFSQYINKPVFIQVRLDSFILREVTDQVLIEYWKKKENKPKIVLEIDSITHGLIDLSNSNINDVKTIGGKAANFSELMKIKLNDSSTLKLPEYRAAIPFYYYIQHIKNHKIDIDILQMLSDTTLKFNTSLKKERLQKIRDKINKSPIDPVLLELVKNFIKLNNADINFRFRSSTNAEDIDGFNGAGLYDSYSGNLSDKEIDKAIKKVWASLWNDRAYDERNYFGIDHKNVAMAVMIHRSFTSEYANGVIITHNPFNQYNDAIYINVQPEEISVVRPDTELIPEQILYYTYKIKNEAYEYLSRSSHPDFIDHYILTQEELKILQSYALAIKNHYCSIKPPCKVMDIEFKVDIIDGNHRIYIKQARIY